MEKVSTLGMDIAKHVFQIHGVDAFGVVVLRRKLRRDDVAGFFKALPPCLIGIEACATAHNWARVVMALGHEVRLMPASYVKPYVKRQKNAEADAKAICEAVARPTMRSVPVKSQEQQTVLMLHRVRELLIRQRTMLVALHGHLAEFGMLTRQGAGVGTLIALVEDQDAELLLPLARAGRTSSPWSGKGGRSPQLPASQVYRTDAGAVGEVGLAERGLVYRPSGAARTGRAARERCHS